MHYAGCMRKMLMLLSVHVTGILFLVQFNNFTLTMGFYWSYMFLLFERRGKAFHVGKVCKNDSPN